MASTSKLSLGPATDPDGDAVSVSHKFAYGYFSLSDDLVLSVDQNGLLGLGEPDTEL